MNNFGNPTTFLGVMFLAYMLGSLNGAQILHSLARGKWPGRITRIGTKNAGAQNVFMYIGKGSGAIVFLIDFLKAASAIQIAALMGLSGAGVFLAGTFAIVGHNWPIFFHFRGGRGFASLIGAFYSFNIFVGIIASIVSIPFQLLRYAGIVPFIFLVVGAVIHGITFGMPLILVYVATALVLYIRRIHATWDELKASPHKLRILRNNFIYDRATTKPPSLKKVFF